MKNVAAESSAPPARWGSRDGYFGYFSLSAQEPLYGIGAAFTPTLEQELGQSCSDEYPGMLLRGVKLL